MSSRQRERDLRGTRLRHIILNRVRRWRAEHLNMGPRTRNTYVGSLRALCRWAAKEGLLLRDPLERVEMASETADKRRRRQALTEDEFHKLLVVARERPLQEALTIRRGPRKGEPAANIRPKIRRQLELLGRERSLIYATFVSTGLRRGESASLRVGDLSLNGVTPTATIRAASSKARKEQIVPLRDDLAGQIAAWEQATGKGAEDLLFVVPRQLVKIFKRDLTLAGITQRNAAGRVLDVHARYGIRRLHTWLGERWHLVSRKRS